MQSVSGAVATPGGRFPRCGPSCPMGATRCVDARAPHARPWRLSAAARAWPAQCPARRRRPAGVSDRRRRAGGSDFRHRAGMSGCWRRAGVSDRSRRAGVSDLRRGLDARRHCCRCRPIAAALAVPATGAGRARPGRGRQTGTLRPYQWPVLGMLAQGSRGSCAPPALSSSMEILSGERTKAIRPSRGGRLIVTPLSIRCWHMA